VTSSLSLSVRLVQTDEDILACFPVMVQLRTHPLKGEFLDRVRQQEKAGYRLVLLEDGNYIQAVAGFRFSESLAWGKQMHPLAKIKKIKDCLASADTRHDEKPQYRGQGTLRHLSLE